QSLKDASTDPKAHSKTLLLPKTSFPLWVDSAKSKSLLRSKTCQQLYRWQTQNAHEPLFALLDGPPYASGHLDIGHALNKIIKDIINRYQVLTGHRVRYHPGWDCHGLPIENKALQELKFCIMADWSPKTTFRTLDHGYEICQLQVFQPMVEQGLIYRHYRPSMRPFCWTRILKSRALLFEKS
ncbi:hypothetical protein DEU56DRAFT_825882, partial [Suillus clintonianus]|uniref:uncharacterized protein n=1 Tax=Suillus clintonianus TaxID=1904413 RepID=UPI001B873941